MELELNKIYNMNCLEGMQKIEDKSVDMILCDLPYGTTACKWDTIIPFEPMWEQLNRIIKPNGAICLFGSEPFSSALRMSNIKNYRYDWIWHKNLSGSFATAKKMPMKYHENISVFYKKLPTYNPQFQPYAESVGKRFKDGEMVNRKKEFNNSTNSLQGGLSFEGTQPIDTKRGKYPESVQFFKSEHTANGKRLHPTQKPVNLLEYLIKTYTNEGETVLDNCIGSGTTAIACMNTKRNYIGFELNKEYFDIAEKRIKDKEKENIQIGIKEVKE